VAYIVSGAGGYANTERLMHKIEKAHNGHELPVGFQTTHLDLKLMRHNDKLPGFLRITSDGNEKNLTCEYFTILFDGTSTATRFDSVTIEW
jgi:hypothetical protein